MPEIPANNSREIKPETQEYLARYDGFILLDLDKTVIDAEYQPTADIVPTLEKARAANMCIGLHSDTPRIALEKWTHELGLIDTEGNPDTILIGELGGVIAVPQTGEKIITVRGADMYFGQLKHAVQNTVADENHILWHEGDIVNETRQGVAYPGVHTHGVFVNDMREVSFGAWFSSIDEEGNRYHDPEFYAHMTGQVEAQINALKGAGAVDLREPYDFNEEYSIAIIQAAQPDKTNAYRSLISWVPGIEKKPLYMIGDSMSDWIEDPRVTTLAVANAKAELKDKVGAANISQGEYTEGVIEHIEAILAR